MGINMPNRRQKHTRTLSTPSNPNRRAQKQHANNENAPPSIRENTAQSDYCCFEKIFVNLQKKHTALVHMHKLQHCYVGIACPTEAKNTPKYLTKHRIRTVVLKNNTPTMKIHSA